MRRRLLWRVRRKLILSYVFVGLVPSLLIVAFFLLAGLLLFRNMASYLVQTRINAQAEQARFLAQAVLLDVQRAPTAEAVRDTLDRQQASGSTRYPFLSIALVPARELACPQAVAPVASGRMPPVPCRPPPGRGPTWRSAGAAGVDDLRRRRPGDRLRRRRGRRGRGTRRPHGGPRRGGAAGALADVGGGARPADLRGGRRADRRPRPASASARSIGCRSTSAGTGPRQPHRRRTDSAAPAAWPISCCAAGSSCSSTSTGRPARSARSASNCRSGWSRCIAGSPLSRRWAARSATLLLVLLAAAAALFLLIQGVALVIGLALARQITGAVARPVHRHAASAQSRLHPHDPGAGPRPARRAGRLVQRHDRRGRPGCSSTSPRRSASSRNSPPPARSR